MEDIKQKVTEFTDRSSGKEYEEGERTRFVEHQTAKLPSLAYLGAAVACMAASAGLAFFADKDKKPLANFVGLWAPSILIMGLYNKLVKIEGSSKSEKAAA